MTTRRTLLQGLAALPVAGIPFLLPDCSSQSDPIIALHRERDAVVAAINAVNVDADDRHADDLQDRWSEIDKLATGIVPRTLGGAIAAGEWLRAELLEFHATSECPDDRLVVSLIEGLLNYLQTAKGGMA